MEESADTGRFGYPVIKKLSKSLGVGANINYTFV
jgi:hypothetical protein